MALRAFAGVQAGRGPLRLRGGADRRVRAGDHVATGRAGADGARRRRRRQGRGYPPPFAGEARRASLERVMGVDLTAIPTIGLETVLIIATEVGPDLSAYPDCYHFSSLLSPCARHRSRLARLDKAKAIKATARELPRLIRIMIGRGQGLCRKGRRGLRGAEKEAQDRLSQAHREGSGSPGLRARGQSAEGISGLTGVAKEKSATRLVSSESKFSRIIRRFGDRRRI